MHNFENNNHLSEFISFGLLTLNDMEGGGGGLVYIFFISYSYLSLNKIMHQKLAS